MHKDEDRLLGIAVQINPNLLPVKLARVESGHRTDIYLQSVRVFNALDQCIEDHPEIHRVCDTESLHAINLGCFIAASTTSSLQVYTMQTRLGYRLACSKCP